MDLGRPRGLAQPQVPEGQHGGQQRGGQAQPGQRPPPAQHQRAGQRRVDGDQHERDRVDAAQLGDLDHRQPQVLRVAERAPRKSPEEMTAQPLAADPQARRRGQRPARREPARDEAHQPADGGHVEPAPGGEQEQRPPRERPRDRAVRPERVVEPAQEHEEEGETVEPAPAEGHARRGADRRHQQRHQREPAGDLPVGAWEGQRQQERAAHEQRRLAEAVAHRPGAQAPAASRSARKRGRPAATILRRVAA